MHCEHAFVATGLRTPAHHNIAGQRRVGEQTRRQKVPNWKRNVAGDRAVSVSPSVRTSSPACALINSSTTRYPSLTRRRAVPRLERPEVEQRKQQVGIEHNPFVGSLAAGDAVHDSKSADPPQ
jgi:hypothetical protein